MTANSTWRKALRAFEKIRLRISQISMHPISRHAPFKGVLRYLFFNSVIRTRRKLKYNWIHGLKFTVKRGEAGIVGNVYFGMSNFEDSGFLLHFLRSTDLFVDVGANVGHFTLLASGIRKCKSIAIEPVPHTHSRLRENVGLNNLNDFVTTLNIGVGERKDQLYFSVDRGAMNRIVSKDYPNSLPIPVDCLDSILSSLVPAVIKIDVEGFEYFVLQGSRVLLRNPSLKCVVIEANGSGAKYGKSDADVLSILKSYGFSPFQYDPFSRDLAPLRGDTLSHDILFIRDIDFVMKRCHEAESFKVWGVIV